MVYGGVGSLLVLILDIYCIMLILQGSGDSGIKLLWIILVIFLPILGPILYIFSWVPVDRPPNSSRG